MFWRQYLSTLKMAYDLLNLETKRKLKENITSNMNDLAGLLAQVKKGSKSNEVSKLIVSVFILVNEHYAIMH